MSGRPYLLALFSAVLLALNIAVWHAVAASPAHTLRVSFLDVGQGDSILIQGPAGADMLVDGGPDRSVLRQLPPKLGFFDRNIDLLVETHPDKDHIAGLTEILHRYAVSYFLDPGIPNDTSYAIALEGAVKAEPGVTRFTARRGMRIHLGDGAYADVLFPDRDVSKGDTNDGSVTLRVVYGTTSFLMAGDLPSSGEDYLVSLDGRLGGGSLRSDVLKASHHGSNHSSDALWLDAVHPSTVVISAGRGNSYGHPAPAVLERVRAEGARIVSTMDLGTITFVSDGATIRQQ